MGKKSRQISSMCPCGSGRAYDQCCAVYLRESQQAPTAEALMRSRYVAYVLNNAQYLMATWHTSTRPEYLELTPETNPRWVRLNVKQHIPGEELAIVEFIATYQVNGRAHALHETSRFIREEGRWRYVDGEIH